jgi:hypothetical protein
LIKSQGKLFEHDQIALILVIIGLISAILLPKRNALSEPLFVIQGLVLSPEPTEQLLYYNKVLKFTHNPSSLEIAVSA